MYELDAGEGVTARRGGGGGVNPSDGRQGTRQAAKEVIRIKQHKTTSYFRSRKKGKAKPC